MGYGRNNERKANYEAYTKEQISAVAEYCGLEILDETASHYLIRCPFHDNTDKPTFALDKSKGLWTCFNPSCGRNIVIKGESVFKHSQGNLKTLLRRLDKDSNPFAIRRILDNYQPDREDLEVRLSSIREEKVEEFVEFPTDDIDYWADLMFVYPTPLKYMQSRGFTTETLEYFGVGYSDKDRMIITPMHDTTGMCVGYIGRALEEKKFKNSFKLPKSRLPWNFHRAKRHGDTVIIVESAFDAMRIHQAGYPNVVALLGGSLSDEQIALLERTFSKIVIMTDNDYTGRRLGHTIRNNIAGTVMWAAYDDTCIYPHDAKDAGDMTDEEIRQCLRNAVSNFEYEMWGIEEQESSSTRCIDL